MTALVAAKGFAAHLERAWIPTEGAFNVELIGLSEGDTASKPVACHAAVLGELRVDDDPWIELVRRRGNTSTYGRR